MRDQANSQSLESQGDISATLYKKDFWSQENLKYGKPHHRLEKSARIINRLAQGKECTLLDVGCGPATLMSLLRPNIRYHGIDIAIHAPAQNLVEADFLEAPIKFGDKTFDIVVAQGVFEYVGDFQARKFAEISQLLNGSGMFIVSYVNFGHRSTNIYWPYSNVQALGDFRRSLACHFRIQRFFPTSHNWNHIEPSRRLVRTANMHINFNIPFVSRVLAVEYFFICSKRKLRVPCSVAAGRRVIAPYRLGHVPSAPKQMPHRELRHRSRFRRIVVSRQGQGPVIAEPGRCPPQCKVFIIGERDLGRGDVALELLDASGARDSDDSRAMNDPGQRDLCRARGMRVGHLAQHGNQLARPGQVLGTVERVGGLDVVDGWCGAVILPRQ